MAPSVYQQARKVRLWREKCADGGQAVLLKRTRCPGLVVLLGAKSAPMQVQKVRRHGCKKCAKAGAKSAPTLPELSSGRQRSQRLYFLCFISLVLLLIFYFWWRVGLEGRRGTALTASNRERNQDGPDCGTRYTDHVCGSWLYSHLIALASVGAFCCLHYTGNPGTLCMASGRLCKGSVSRSGYILTYEDPQAPSRGF